MTDSDDAGVRVARGPEDREAALAVRRAVFVDEQGVPEEIEYDGRDDEAIHFVADDGNRAVGAARLRPLDDVTAKVERVAVLPEARGEGWGDRLMDAVESKARRRGIRRLTLHAQLSVEGFYARRGYERVGEEFEEAGIPHVEMAKPIEP